MLPQISTNRKVNRLELKANNYADVQQAILLIEDALRTASFPGLPKNGLVLIRRLELGKLHISNNSIPFSNRIDQLFLALQPQLIRFGQEEQPEASVVWFSDSIEPYVMLAHLLAKGITPISWYWPLAVPNWKPIENTQTALEQLIMEASKTEQGLLMVTTIVDRLTEDGTVDQLIKSLTTDKVEKILRNIKVEPTRLSANAADKSTNQETIKLTGYWQGKLQKWITQLGADDSRCFLLALSAAVAHDFTTAEFSVGKILAQESRLNDFDGGFPLQGNHDQQDDVKGIVKDYVEGKFALTEDQPINEENYVDTLGSDAKHKKQQLDNNVSNLQYPLGQLSSNAGFALLINVLERLQINESLAQFEMLRELNLPNHIFWACVTKLKIRSGDSVCQWLTDKDKLLTGKQHCPFIAPQSWINLLFASHRAETVVLRRVRSDSKKHLLCDSSGQIVLAIWRGKMPVAVNELIDGRKIKLLPAINEANDLQLIIASHVFAIKRFLRRYANTGLKAVVKKRGHVAISKTHLDVSFSMQAVDIDSRKAGLDIDPGWVPWLGRVVLFHYLEDEQ